MLLTGSWSHLVSRYAGLDLRTCMHSRTGGFFYFFYFFCLYHLGASSSSSTTSIGMLSVEELQSDFDDGCDSQRHCATFLAGHERLERLFSLSVSLSLSLSLSSALSLSLSLSLNGSLPTRKHSASTSEEKEGLTGCERELREGVQVTGRCTEITKEKKLMIMPLLLQAQEVVQEMLDAPKLRKVEKKKKKATGSAIIRRSRPA